MFGIGLPFSGGSLLHQLFDANGYLWRHKMAGKLAQSIAYAQATGTVPLRTWGKAHGFSGLYSLNNRHLPPLTAYGMFRYLHTHFPDAYFIHTSRDPADWVSARFMANDGEHRAIAAWHSGVEDRALPAIWLEAQAKHQAACAGYFADNPRFLDFNVTTDNVDKLCAHVAADYKLELQTELPDYSIPAQTVTTVLSHLEDESDHAKASPSADPAFVARVAAHCRARAGQNGRPEALSKNAIRWVGATPTDRRGAKVAMTQKNGRGAYLLDAHKDVYERAQSTLNDLIDHGAKPPFWLDMMDARYIGSNGRRPAPERTVAYNRRTGATNLTLWPLPDYHTLAPNGHPSGYPDDTVNFKDKEDHCVWLGNMTGRMLPELAAQGRDIRSVYDIRDEAETLSKRSRKWADIIDDLMAVSRYRLVKTYRDHPDFTVGLVLRARWKALSDTPAFKDVTSDKQPRHWFHRFRYVLSLAGNDTGSNFLSAAASNSVILKEEDGWELFYTSEFKPWIHYIPLELGAQDVEEKLQWARTNQEACAKMATASREVFDAFANPANRAAYLREIAADLNRNR